jgi:predicted transcriptional regulator
VIRKIKGDIGMQDKEEAQLKAEIDAIMEGVENVMKKIEHLLPQENTQLDPADE